MRPILQICNFVIFVWQIYNMKSVILKEYMCVIL